MGAEPRVYFAPDVISAGDQLRRDEAHSSVTRVCAEEEHLQVLKSPALKPAFSTTRKAFVLNSPLQINEANGNSSRPHWRLGHMPS
jgi:hypothetical protein